MRDTNLVNALREHAEWAEGNQYETPITLCDDLAEAADLIEAQAKEIEKLRAQLPRWIPVEERLPETDAPVLCWYEYFRYGEYNQMYRTYGIGYCINERWGGEVSNGRNAKVLAWMPLPEPLEEAHETLTALTGGKTTPDGKEESIKGNGKIKTVSGRLP